MSKSKVKSVMNMKSLRLKFDKQTENLMFGILIGLLFMMLMSKLLEPNDHRMAYLEETKGNVLNSKNYGIGINNNQMVSDLGIPMYADEDDEEESDSIFANALEKVKGFMGGDEKKEDDSDDDEVKSRGGSGGNSSSKCKKNCEDLCDDLELDGSKKDCEKDCKKKMC